MEEFRISKSATASLVFGMLFYIPLVSGLAAILFGLFALRSIQDSSKKLLGRGLARAGITLGFVSAIAWAIPLTSNAVFFVNPLEQGVVLKKGKIAEQVSPGLNFSNPFSSRVFVFKRTDEYLGRTGLKKYLFQKKTFFEMNAVFAWRICDPQTYVLKSPNPSNPKSMEKLLGSEISDVIRDVIYDQDIATPDKLSDLMQYETIRKKSEEIAGSYGVCLLKNPKDGDKAIYLLVSIP